jgi:hypothetical protein
MAIGVRHRVRHRPAGQPLHLGEDAARGLLVDLGERSPAQPLAHPEDLEQGELDVPQVAPVVAHRGGEPFRSLLIGNHDGITHR